MKQNLIIRASAGTGKTFSLATRFIGLMLFQNVPPERILALTFSRAAAQEIYMKLLERLWKASASDAGAAAEREILCGSLGATERARVEAAVRDWSRHRFTEILRRVIAVQHHGTIATLDSFILRIVRSFPLEMGFQNAVDVLDGFGVERAIGDACTALLSREDAAEDLVAAYRTATGGAFARTCVRTLDAALAGWRAFLLGHRTACENWTPASMRSALGIADRPEMPDFSVLPLTGKRNDPKQLFIKHVASFLPDGPVFAANNGGDMARFLFEHPEATAYEYETPSGKAVVVECGAEGASAVRAGVKYMLDRKLARQIDIVAAKLALCRMVENEYDASTRRRGMLTFSDFTDCQAVAEEDSEASLRLENLQFRFDSRFDHWALDEFQDTSELQWRCLRRLVKEAAQPDGGRSVMAVGDLKQSIYTWRGGNDAPFKEMMDRWDEFRGDSGEVVPNAVSYRYGKNTADFINLVFGPENVRGGEVLGDFCRPAVDRWLASDCWMEHKPETRNGRPNDGDYVEVIEVEKPQKPSDDGESAFVQADGTDDGGAALKILAPGICALVADLWAEHERARSTETIGILVRNNKDGAKLAERLRTVADGTLPIVWEGVDRVADAPVVKAVLQLLWLAEHPQDSFAWAVVNDLLPIRKTVFPALVHQEKVSQQMAEWISRLGLARALKEIVARICATEPRPDARSIIRLEGLVREAVNYEQRKDATAGVGNFIAYVMSAAGREASTSPHVIRILTIHRSKGLTLDHVIVPILETGTTDSICRPRKGQPLFGDGWAVQSLPMAEARLNAQTAAVWEKAANERVIEQLRLNYVAMTRARKSTHVFVCRDSHDGAVQFRDLVLKPFADRRPQRECSYGSLVCELGTMPQFGRRESEELAPSVWTHGKGDRRVAHRSPSTTAASHGSGWKTRAASLFGDESTAAEKGTAAHAEFAAMEWIDPSAPKNELERGILATAWRTAFIRPSEAATLWRERSYERFADGVWETGRFDRVVFADGGAVVYDFKTNAKNPRESDADFARRMSETYAGQMEAYRISLAALTNLPVESIRTVLLIQETGAAVEVPI